MTGQSYKSVMRKTKMNSVLWWDKKGTVWLADHAQFGSRTCETPIDYATLPWIFLGKTQGIGNNSTSQANNIVYDREYFRHSVPIIRQISLTKQCFPNSRHPNKYFSTTMPSPATVTKFRETLVATFFKFHNGSLRNRKRFPVQLQVGSTEGLSCALIFNYIGGDS